MTSICIHPKNREELFRIVRPMFSISERDINLFGIPLIESDHLPERFYNSVWHPPEGDRFVEYDSSDEAWMRPLGLGRVEQIDMGPYILLMQEKLNLKIEGILSEVLSGVNFTDIGDHLRSTPFKIKAFESMLDIPRPFRFTSIFS